MKRLAIPVAIVVTLGLSGCGGGSSTTPTPSTITVFTVQMSPANENPPITNVESTASGTAVVTVHSDTNVIEMLVNVRGLQPDSVLNNAHIHGPNAPAGSASAGVFVGSGIAAAAFPAVVNGNAQFTASPTATADQVAQILANPQNFYFNVHTVRNGPGVMRGQLR